jgi:23S rRNA A1618 N6-methylase RlmF
MRKFSSVGTTALDLSSLYDVAEEYDVYIYNPPLTKQGDEAWEKKRTTVNRLRALAAARKLHESKKYGRVEIKKKAYDQKNRRSVSTTFKVYEGVKQAPKKSYALHIALGMALAASVAVLALITIF